ncbi:uncharacterized protein LOC116290257 [Actinia tenebrosa]|uniref:Uncharacterized protein LOC116290257 n=1 Tax=Actinia tenebrosa TaxID=6105 RepID=A0A6P8HDI6_ACTTE|nr:uncharacterized protein LOC116290257 [Actinia tenebrosa]
MAILHALLLVLSMAVLQPTKSEIIVPFSSEIFIPFVEINIFCTVKNEHFIGWFKDDSNIKIPVVPRRADAKGKPAVVIETRVGTLKKTCILIIPRGVGFRTATGRYICKGQRNQEIVVVQSRCEYTVLSKKPVVADRPSDHAIRPKRSMVSEVFVPFTEATLKPKFGLSIVCYIRNEHFIGWFKANSKIKIPVVASKADVKDEPAVVIATVSNKTTEALMIFPRGSPVSNAGKYVCTGGIHRAVVKVISKII